MINRFGILCPPVSWQFSDFYTKLPDFYANIFTPSSFLCPYCYFVYPSLTVYEASSLHRLYVLRALCYWKREGNTRLGRKRKSFVRLCVKLFWSMIYCANTILKPDSRFGSLSHRKLGRGSPLIIHQYYLMTAIAIQPITQPCTCKMGSSIFSAVSRLKLAKYDQGLLSKHTINRKKKRRKCFCWSWKFLPCLSLFYFSHRSRCILLDPYCGCHSMSPPVWHQWWHQFEFPIGPGWGCRVSYPTCPSPDRPPPLIFCAPGELGVYHLPS